LKNSYSLIKEDVDKENYMTPVMGVESPGLKGKESGFKMNANKLEKNIEKMINRISLESKSMLNIDEKEFNELFVEALRNMSSKVKESESNSVRGDSND
jgi:pyruvate formate-lyase activating enzyme-like uncharacterized protein